MVGWLVRVDDDLVRVGVFVVSVFDENANTPRMIRNRERAATYMQKRIYIEKPLQPKSLDEIKCWYIDWIFLNLFIGYKNQIKLFFFCCCFTALKICCFLSVFFLFTLTLSTCIFNCIFIGLIFKRLNSFYIWSSENYLLFDI